MDISTGIAALHQSLNTINVLVKGLVSVRDQAKFAEMQAQFAQAIVAVTEQVHSLQEERARLLERQREAEDEIRRLQDRQADMANYELHALRPGLFVYALKPEAKTPGAPDHYLCQPCREKGTKSVLQVQPETQERYLGWKCPVDPQHSVMAKAKPFEPIPSSGRWAGPTGFLG